MNEFTLKVPGLEFDRIKVTDEFINSNVLKLSRTQSELIDKINERRSQFMSFWPEVLSHYFTKRSILRISGLYEKETIDKIKSGELDPNDFRIKDIHESVQDFLDYMVFAWGKALDMRGLSASRSIDKLSAWMWLLGRDDLSELLNRQDLYNPYGTPALIKVCEELGIKVPEELIEFSYNKC